MMTKREYSYDHHCGDLAETFLAHEPHDDADVDNLAQTIQDAIESWLFNRAPSPSDREGT